ncbi:sulfatase [Pedobacter sp. SD-b]|uniref:Sulfatase n=1 Tax=Pedobacter segetis TaxID=2793069 RepID=A0ABS1BLG5_9SPHI|nr:sulfatase [Pedobacter segetis]MBK0383622.1 sulfatase [Pedobacter segetis]
MMNRINIKQIITSLFLLGIIFSVKAQNKVKQNKTVEKPNVIFILVDDMGWKDLGVYGSTFYESPNIDKLASQGVRFTDAYASSPVCSPSRSSIMTGQYPVNTGITDWIPGSNRFRKSQPYLKLIEQSIVNNLPKSNISLGQAFKNNGYATCYSGKWHLGESEEYYPEAEGFDYNYGGWAAGNPRAAGMKGYFSPYNNPKLKDGPVGEFLTDRLTTETINFIKKQAKSGKPFFADLSFYAVHEPIEAKQEYIKKFTDKAHNLGLDTLQQFVKDADWMQQNPSFKERIIQADPVYAGLIYTVDENVGRIMTTLKELGIDKNTIIVFTSDNGGLSTAERSPTTNYPLRYGKGWNYEGGVRIPLIIKWPGFAKPGTISNFPVVNTDFYPTLLEMSGLPQLPEQTKDGVSIVPLLKGDKSIDQPILFWHYPHYGDQGGSPASSIRMGDWKLVQFYYDNHTELYNLRIDLEERRDLSRAFPEKTADLLQRLNDWKKSTNAKTPLINPYYNPDYKLLKN